MTVRQLEKAERPYRIEVTRDQSSSPSKWPTCVVRILHGDAEIGSYHRNYAAFAEHTFEPFELKGSWYALYSRDYTATRVMKLPECQDLGGEEPVAHGFCPVELFVPRYRKIVMTDRAGGRETEHWWFESAGEEATYDSSRATSDIVFGPWQSLEVGFVAGCHWGDDSTWKLEVFDLSRAAEGVIPRLARFGHLQLGTMPLCQALRFDRHLPHWDLRATVIRQERRDVWSGDLIDPYDE